MELGETNLDLFENRESLREQRQSTLRKTRLARQSNAVVLTSRDFEILRFILEMKFASATEVFEKFFRITKDLFDAKSDGWAKKRLLQLERSGFLRASYSFAESKKFFVGTYRGYYAVQNFYSLDHLPKPVPGFDMRTFVHDRLVLQCRMRLERDGIATDWISDRMLKSGSDRLFGFNSKHIPDAIYTTPATGKVVFEVENSQKARVRYRDKIKSYVNLMRSSKAQMRFDKVRFCCFRDPCFEVLKSEARIYGDLFSVERLEPSQLIVGET